MELADWMPPPASQISTGHAATNQNRLGFPAVPTV